MQLSLTTMAALCIKYTDLLESVVSFLKSKCSQHSKPHMQQVFLFFFFLNINMPRRKHEQYVKTFSKRVICLS